MLQEDVPEEFATLVLNFISRNRIGPHGVEVGIHILFLNMISRKGILDLWYSVGISFLFNFFKTRVVHSTLEIIDFKVSCVEAPVSVPLPPKNSRWRVRLWVQDALGVCATYQ